MRTLLVTALSVITASCGGGAAQPVITGGAPPSPAVISTPAPAGTAQPFGPPWLTAQDAKGVGWVGCIDYEPGRDGDGCFIQFLTQNKAGVYKSGVTLNGGLVDATTGAEQGDLDVAFMVNGQLQVVSFTGPYLGNLAGILPWPPDSLAIGSATNRFASIYLTVLPPRPGMPPQAIGSVKVSGGYVAIYP